MFSKPVRFGLLIVGLLITAALGYRAVEDEASLGRVYREAAVHGRAAAEAHEALLDLRSALHAYVAPGQGLAFWSRRAGQSLDALREHLAALDTALTPLGRAAADALDAADQLATAERRAREYVGRGETLPAGDVVFIEVRDVMQAASDHIHQAGAALAAAHEARAAGLRRNQMMLAAAGVLMWVLIAALFVIPMKSEPEKKPEQWRHELAATIKKPIPKDPVKADPVRSAEAAEGREGGPKLAAGEGGPPVPSLPVTAISDVGEICSDLSSLSDLGALTGALSRVAGVLDASGVIVWLASNDGSSLSPVASHGFDQKLVSRIGRIPRDSANLTAAAFRENVPRVSAATAEAPAALAVALCGPTGAVGVLSVELKPDVPADEGRVALATIFAAQLATLAAPLPSAPVAPGAPVAPAKSAAI
jgi:hypothetical protein